MKNIVVLVVNKISENKKKTKTPLKRRKKELSNDYNHYS